MFYWICIVFILVQLIFRIKYFIRYKRSGTQIFIASFKIQDFLFVALWLAIGGFWISNIFRNKGLINATGSWLFEPISWIFLISLVIINSLQRTKITQGGILYSSYFWEWREIVSFEWTSKYTLIVNVKPKFRIFKPTITIDLWKKRDHKDSIEQLFNEHFSTNI
ncbi:MAG: hypothetical protein WA131_06640 [Desulfitobacteriaceae bacterium]